MSFTMNMLLMFFIGIALLDLCVAVDSLSEGSIPPATVSSIELSSYLGKWYQTYASFLPNSTYEKDGSCVKADYTFISDTEFAILNSEYVGDLSNPKDVHIRTATGTSTLPNPNEPGKWIVQFDTSMYKGLYWIIELGPIVNGLYDYSVVSAPLGIQLFVLARDVQRFEQEYEKKLIPRLIKEGFVTPFNRPLKTYQGPLCP